MALTSLSKSATADSLLSSTAFGLCRGRGPFLFAPLANSILVESSEYISVFRWRHDARPYLVSSFSSRRRFTGPPSQARDPDGKYYVESDRRPHQNAPDSHARGNVCANRDSNAVDRRSPCDVTQSRLGQYAYAEERHDLSVSSPRFRRICESTSIRCVPRYFVTCLTSGRSDARAYARLQRVRTSGPATTRCRGSGPARERSWSVSLQGALGLVNAGCFRDVPSADILDDARPR